MAASRFKFLLLLVALAGSAAAPLIGQSGAPAPQVTDATAGDLGRLRDLTEAKDYATALSVIDHRLAAVPADSYDRSLLLQIKVQIHLTQGNYTAALEPLENVLRLGERPGYLSAGAFEEFQFLLAQLYQQRGSEAKDLRDQTRWLDKAIAQFRAWQSRTGKRTPEGQLFAASVLYQRATLDPKNLDKTLLSEARRAAEEGLVLTTKPSASLYAVILAVLQHTEDFKTSAELLELLLADNPSQTGYSQQLVSNYLNLAAAASANPREAARYNLRAVIALERAQARGALTSPKENFNLVALYLAVDQPAKAIALLEKGLASGTIENTRRNWEILANTYQQSQREDGAIAALEKAVKTLPSEGQLEFMLAQLLYGRTRVADARARLEAAVGKGHLDKPGQARLFLAYIAYELQDFDAALRWAGEADRFNDAKDEDVKRLVKAVTDAVKTRADTAAKS